MLIGKILGGIARGAGKFLGSKAGRATLKGAAVVGAGAAVAGAGLAADAKHKNNKAIAMQQEALQEHDETLKETEKVLSKLSNEESKSVKNFELFLNLTDKINKCPEMDKIKSDVKLPRITRKDLRKINEGFEVALAGIGGAGLSGLAGLAFCGISVGALSFAAFGGGIFICAKGAKLRKQAVNNLKEAENFKKEVDKIVIYYSKLQDASNQLKEAIIKMNSLYVKKLNKLKSLVSKNNNYDKFSKGEKKLVSNCFKLTIMLATLCRTQLAKKVEDEEIINQKEIDKVVKESEIVYDEVDNSIRSRFAKIFA